MYVRLDEFGGANRSIRWKKSNHDAINTYIYIYIIFQINLSRTFTSIRYSPTRNSLFSFISFSSRTMYIQVRIYEFEIEEGAFNSGVGWIWTSANDTHGLIPVRPPRGWRAQMVVRCASLFYPISSFVISSVFSPRVVRLGKNNGTILECEITR